MYNPNIRLLASKGGLARAKSLTKDQLSLSASVAAKARWKAYRFRKNHVCEPFCRCKTCGRFMMKHVINQATSYNSEYCRFICDQ